MKNNKEAKLDKPVKKKKKYTKPAITEHRLDKEICLIMASVGGPPVDPDDPWGSTQQSSSAIFENQGITRESPFKQNPWE